MTTYVARHNLALPVVITAELTTLHPTTPVTTQIRHRTLSLTPTVNLSAPTSGASSHTPTLLPAYLPEDVPPGPPAGLAAPTTQVPPGLPEGHSGLH